jgi:hypothetical protein
VLHHFSIVPTIPSFPIIVIASLFSSSLIVLSSFHYFLMFSHNTSWHLLIVLSIPQTWMWCPFELGKCYDSPNFY